MIFCNTKTTVTFHTVMLHSHTQCTLLLRVADGYVGCLNHVSTEELACYRKTKTMHL
jgi:hypothetical protein